MSKKELKCFEITQAGANLTIKTDRTGLGTLEHLLFAVMRQVQKKAPEKLHVYVDTVVAFQRAIEAGDKKVPAAVVEQHSFDWWKRLMEDPPHSPWLNEL